MELLNYLRKSTFEEANKPALKVRVHVNVRLRRASLPGPSATAQEPDRLKPHFGVHGPSKIPLQQIFRSEHSTAAHPAFSSMPINVSIRSPAMFLRRLRRNHCKMVKKINLVAKVPCRARLVARLRRTCSGFSIVSVLLTGATCGRAAILGFG